MRKIIVISYVTLDGVIQSMGGAEEDTSGSFAYGGWVAPYFDDELGSILGKEMSMPFDLLIGRKTFDIWSPYWPQHVDVESDPKSVLAYKAGNSCHARRA